MAPALHLINDEGSMVASVFELTNLVKQANVESPLDSLENGQSTTSNNGNYNIVGIMGCQSSGKSTLLNALFDTEFKTMNASQGRQQTTKGVWMQAASSADRGDNGGLLVMDLEGTDSGERGEDRMTFERQTTLFALALAEVLIINMWEHDIGRYTASNYDILKIVFEVNLELFQPNVRTVLLFIIRDHDDSETGFDSIQKKLRNQIDKIWADLRKPSNFLNTQIDELFELRYIGLPHKNYQREAFEADVGKLRRNLLNPNDSDYFFRNNIKASKAVPIDGFGAYVTQVWQTIKSNRQLDLPSQREMLATFRCDEIISMLMQSFIENLKPIWKTVNEEKRVVQDFGHVSSKLVQTTLQAYNKSTEHYLTDIVGRKQFVLMEQITEELSKLFCQQMKFVTNTELDVFQCKFRENLAATQEEVPDSFYAIADQVSTDVLENVRSTAENLCVPGIELPTSLQLNELSDQIDGIISSARSNRLNRFENSYDKLIKQHLGTELAAVLKDAKPNMWDIIAEKRKHALNIVDKCVADKYKAYRASDAELLAAKKCIQQHLDDIMRTMVEQHASLILLHMRDRFDRLFRYDEDGLLRRWKFNDNPRDVFFASRDEAIKLLDLFALWRLDAPEEQENAYLEVIGETKRTEIELLFTREIEGALREAEAEKEHNSRALKVPAWAIVLIIFLGFDELLVLLRNPLLLVLFSIIGGGLYIAYTFNFVEPGLTLAHTAAQTALRHTTDYALHIIQRTHTPQQQHQQTIEMNGRSRNRR